MIAPINPMAIQPYNNSNMVNCTTCEYYACRMDEVTNMPIACCIKENKTKGRKIPNIAVIPAWCPKRNHQKVTNNNKHTDGWYV